MLNPYRKNDTITITIEDDGIEIPENIRDEIFTRGSKGVESSCLGIGLNLVKIIAENYNSEVLAKDSELGGTKLDVILNKYLNHNNN